MAQFIALPHNRLPLPSGGGLPEGFFMPCGVSRWK